jgi:hypothetical protein
MSDFALLRSDTFRRFRRCRIAIQSCINELFVHCESFTVACVRKPPAVLRIVVSRLDQAFAHFAQIPYHDARTRRDIAQMLDDLEDWADTPRIQRLR